VRREVEGGLEDVVIGQYREARSSKPTSGAGRDPVSRVEADLSSESVAHFHSRREVSHRCDAFFGHPPKWAETALVVGWVEKPNARAVLDNPLSLCDSSVGFGDASCDCFRTSVGGCVASAREADCVLKTLHCGGGDGGGRGHFSRSKRWVS
jgi:hypothetical protein